MEHLTGILVTFPQNVHKQNNHKKLAKKYRKWAQRSPKKIQDIYAESKGYPGGSFEQFKFLLIQFCSDSVLMELDAILELKHATKNEYRHMTLENGTVVIYAIGHVAYILRLAIAFGFGPVLQIKDSYEY